MEVKIWLQKYYSNKAFTKAEFTKSYKIYELSKRRILGDLELFSIANNIADLGREVNRYRLLALNYLINNVFYNRAIAREQIELEYEKTAELIFENLNLPSPLYGCIYAISREDRIYIGSTEDFKKRIKTHMKDKSCTSRKIIYKEGLIQEFQSEILYEMYDYILDDPLLFRNELINKERAYILFYRKSDLNCVNCILPGLLNIQPCFYCGKYYTKQCPCRSKQINNSLSPNEDEEDSDKAADF